MKSKNFLIAAAALVGVGLVMVFTGHSQAQTAQHPQYTLAQATAGGRTYQANCAGCHGAATNLGVPNPPQRFYCFISSRMPANNPGGLSSKEYVNIVAYLMSKNHVSAAGKSNLTPQSMGLSGACASGGDSN